MIKTNYFAIPPDMSLKKVFSDLHEDSVTRLKFMNKKITPMSHFWSYLSHNMMVLVLYRFSHYFYCKKFHFLSKILYVLNMIIFACEITPPSSIGPGAHIVHVIGTGIHAKVGKNALFYGRVVLGGSGDQRSDVGWLGGPVIGDNVTFGFDSKVLACVHVGDHAFIGAMSLVTKDVPPYAFMFGIPAKVKRIRAPEETGHQSQLHEEKA
ncbi:MAG: hypothetical protein IT395_05770 [Candidatus Omnitrophica bacterium]|nr:hypothetical protein [Candidatus Omnitrophota bacterium]